TGLVDADAQVADMLRRSAKPVVLAVNKIDAFERDSANIYEFYELGLGDPHPISAANRQGLGDLMDEVTALFPAEEHNDLEEEDDAIRVAVVGKPNVGKSSIINRLIGKERLLVSDIAGTTRDAVDTRITNNGKEYVFIDTAGLRRKNKIKEQLERFMIIRSVGAIERAQVVILVIDAAEGVTEQDAKIAGIAHENGKAILIAVNKWDLIEKDNHTVKEFTNRIRSTLSFIPYAEIIFISASSGQRLNKLYPLIDMLSENHAFRIQTGVLNEVLTRALVMQQPPADRGKPLKIFYMTQVAVRPPTFVVFVNDKELAHFSYMRYLENQLREAFEFRGTPLKFIVRERKD
ncbi:MAG: ribosome biogenesis GTPase Der, partial [Lachnospiraceae bacterium]|nr:ribosome biogenesis GTPase Der [Lachnospiraceae bacterium]